jgi:hypothetical protein
MTSAGGEPTPGMEKGGDNIGWANANLIKLKNEKKSCSRFNWTVKIENNNELI